MNFADGNSSKVKAWRDIWSAGQGIGAIKQVTAVAELVERLKREYDEALSSLPAHSRPRGTSA